MSNNLGFGIHFFVLYLLSAVHWMIEGARYYRKLGKTLFLSIYCLMFLSVFV